MKKTGSKKKLTAFLLAVAMLVTAFNVVPARAATGYLEGIGLSADAKAGKEYSFKIGYAGVKPGTMKIKVDDLKVLKADKDGYNKMVFTVTFRDSFKPRDDEQITKIVDTCIEKELCSVNGIQWCALIDDNTGFCMEGNKDVEMDTVVVDEDVQYYYALSGYNIYVSKMTKICVTTIYPEKYDNLAIGVGVQKKIGHSKADDKFWKGKTKFADTTYYKKNKKNSKWIKTSDYAVDEKDEGQYDSLAEIVKYDINELKDDLTDIRSYVKEDGRIDLESYMMDNGLYSGEYCMAGEDIVNQRSVYGAWDIDVQCVDKDGTTAIYLTKYTNDGEQELYGITAKATDAIEVYGTSLYTSESLIYEKLPLIVAFVLKYPFSDMPYDISVLGLEQM